MQPTGLLSQREMQLKHTQTGGYFDMFVCFLFEAIVGTITIVAGSKLQ